ncbi:MAG: Nucleoside 2-deoxyribosyltransferase [Candidatus Bathyarchaeota archaeon B24]|nr:MAG: Nucleoside 2-deoxyribosyltransferase [Candidatus Bathyarchaeota archaeon B24]
MYGATRSSPKVFLAGPIQGFENKQEYRAVLSKLLEEAGYDVVDPWKREKLYYRADAVAVETARKVVERDLSDIERCDLFLAYMPVLSAGVCMELFYAKRRGKTTMVILTLENPSPWIIAHADYVFKSIEEFKDFLKGFRLRSSSRR